MTLIFVCMHAQYNDLQGFLVKRDTVWIPFLSRCLSLDRHRSSEFIPQATRATFKDTARAVFPRADSLKTPWKPGHNPLLENPCKLRRGVVGFVAYKMQIVILLFSSQGRATGSFCLNAVSPGILNLCDTRIPLK